MLEAAARPVSQDGHGRRPPEEHRDQDAAEHEEAREAGSGRKPNPGGGEGDRGERLVAEELARRGRVQAGAHQLVPQLGFVRPAEPRGDDAADQARKLVERPAESPAQCGRLQR